MNVYITRTGKFLPNAPVFNEDMEQYLGMVDGKPSKARAIVLRNNGIKQRYYALDKEGQVTHTNVEMATKAIQNLFDDNFNVVKKEFLGDQSLIAAKMNQVANQGKAH